MHNSIKEKVLDLTDIAEVIGERIALTPRGRELVGLCPFHDDHDPSLWVNPAKRIFKCWACGAGGDVIKFVQLYDRIGFREALELLAKRAGVETSASVEDRQRDRAREELRRVVEWARNHFRRNLHDTPAGRAALDYAQRRGLSDETITRFNLGLAPDTWDDLCSAAATARVTPQLLQDAGLVAENERGRRYDRFRNRLIFPINDALARPVAFGGRTLGDDPAKYLNSPETPLFHKSRVLYAFDLARDAMRKRNRAIVVEGYMDAVLLHQHGFPHTVATLGTSLTDAHVKLLKPLVNDVVLCFDGDEAGQRAAERGVETAIRCGIDVRVCVLEGGLDPADYVTERGAEAFEAALSAAVDALEFKWQQTVAALGSGQRRSRRAAVDAFLAFVATASLAGGIDPIEQGVLVGRLGELLSLPAETVYGLLGTARDIARRQQQRAPVAADAADMSEAGRYVDLRADAPAGLASAVEEIFGLVLSDSAWFAQLDEVFAQAVAHAEVWQQLLGLLAQLADEYGDFTRADVVQRCDDSAVLELVQVACEYAARVTDPATAFAAAHARLRAELDTLKISDLHERLRTASADPAAQAAFAALVQAAGRREAGFLPPGWRGRPV